LVRVPIEPAFIKLFRKTMEFDGKFDRQLPDFQVLKAPVRPICAVAFGLF
jgi:hypothetical protein